MRVGLLGGTFDPPHVGHLLAASDAVEALGLDLLTFIPAGRQPFKEGFVGALPRQRLEMAELTVAGDPRFGADPIEIDRPGLSFTVETLRALAARDPGATRVLFIGEDLVEQFARWREPERIVELAEVVVLTRTDGVDAAGAADSADEGPPRSPFPMRRLHTRRVDISSTEVRARVRAGKPIRGFVTDAVAAYIAATGLYR